MEVQVIEKIQGRIDRTTGLQINRKLKVAAYARVSTDSEDQLNSFESQVKYYNEKISKNIEWSFVEVYADESISGTQDYKRSNFMRMIQDSMNGKIDLILTKSISRFARNTLDTLKYVRMLKEKNVAILFEIYAKERFFSINNIKKFKIDYDEIDAFGYVTDNSLNNGYKLMKKLANVNPNVEQHIMINNSA